MNLLTRDVDDRGECRTKSDCAGVTDVSTTEYVPQRYALFNLKLNLKLIIILTSPIELAKFGSQAHAHLFIQLHNFPNHYLVLVVGEGDFKHALVSVKAVVENGTASMVIEDIGWLEVARIRGLADIQVSLGSGADDMAEVGIGMKRKIPVENFGGRWKRKAIGLGSGR